MNAANLVLTVRADTSSAKRRAELLLRLPRFLHPFIPLRLAKRWIMRGVKVSVR